MRAALDVLPSRELLAFQLFDWLEIATGDDKDTLVAIIDATQLLAADAFLCHYRQADIEEPWLDASGVHILPAIHEALRQYAELGLFGMSFPEALGGLGLSSPASLAIYASFAAANPSTAGYAMLTTANARLIAAFGTPAQVDYFAIPQIAGRWFGTMCLSEPQAGSSLGDIRTRAVVDGQDALGVRYRLVGNKMWISGGDQDVSENIVHLVLAKIAQEDGSLPEGTKGISLFIVPKWLDNGARNDVAVAGLNHKLGFRGTSNCLLNFGEADGAIGYRVGGPGEGLSQMFMMMNEARIAVGLAAAAMAYRGYRQSLRYAQERSQGRPAGRKGCAPVPILDHPDVRRMILQQKVYAEGALALCFYCSSLVDKGDEDSEAVLALLTPIAKSWPSEFGLMANDIAIQVHGGYGYTRDFDVEQLWRDNRLNPIHEGTTGIQGIDLLGRKILRSDGRSLELLCNRIGETAARAARTPDFSACARDLLAHWRHTEEVIAGLRAHGGPGALDDATVFLRAFGHGVVAWLWLDMALCADRQSVAALRDGVAYTCAFFFENDLPQARVWLDIVGKRSDLVRRIPDEMLG